MVSTFKIICVHFFIYLILINQLSAEEFEIKEKSLFYELKSRGTSKALVSHPIISSGRFLPISSIVPDGSFVEKGQPVAIFDSTGAEYEYKNLLFEKEVVEQQLKYELTEIDNDSLNKQDSLDSFKDQLNVEKARLKRFEELPLEEEVKKSEGQYKIAELEYNSALKDFERDKERFAKQYISKLELETSEQNFEEKKANLEYAAAILAYDKLPTPKHTLRKIELEVESAKLNVEELQNELAKMKSLKEFEKKTAIQKKEIIDNKIALQKKDLESTIIRAPISGYVKHTETGTKLGPGSKFWDEYRFADIPDFTSIVFESQLPEDSRKYFNINDPALIYVNGRRDEPVKGYISHIAGVPIDIGEKSARTYGSKATVTGIKIYQIQVKPAKFETWMKPGMNAEIVLQSAQKFTLPSVPIKFLQVKDGSEFVSLDGVYKQVKGFSNQGWFMIDDRDFLGKKISMNGVFKEDQDKGNSSFAQGRFMASGEVVPYQSTKVIVPDVYREAKITWLRDEESEVKEGDLLIKMSSIDIDKQIDKYETDRLTLENKVNSLEKAADLKRSENEYKISRAKNLMESKKILWEEALNIIEEKDLLKAKLSYLKAQIDYQKERSIWMRLKAQKPEFTSKIELARAERNEKRAKLSLELAEINYNKVKSGSELVDRSEAEMEYIEKKVAYENLVFSRDWQVELKDSEVRKDKLKLELTKITVQKIIKMKDNLEIKAPASGIIRYEKVWDSGLIDRISIGTGLREGMTAMTIPNLSKLYLQVDVPEKYFSMVKPGLEVDVIIPSMTERNFKGVVESIDYILKPISRRDSQIGIYSSQEPLGQTIFTVNISLNISGKKIKPGAIAEAYFPFKQL